MASKSSDPRDPRWYRYRLVLAFIDKLPQLVMALALFFH